MKRSTLLKKIALGVVAALTLSGCSIYGLINGNNSSENSSSHGSFDTSYGDDSEGIVPKKIMDINETNGNYDMPSLGDVNILVIPVSIVGYESNATETNRQKIETAFFGESSETSWESLASFYEKSSYGNLRISGTVSPWFECGYSAYEISSFEDKKSSYFDPTVRILREAVAWYKKTQDSTGREFDSDSDGLIDGVWLVYDAPNYMNWSKLALTDKIKNVFWAYTYSDYELKYAHPANPDPYRYCWASIDFLFSGYGKNGIDTHTYIHETGHLLGLDDYYVASKSNDTPKNYSPMAGIDMMDNNIIDHDSFSKMALGWVEPKAASKNGTYTLKPYQTDGDCLIIPTDRGWNGSPFDEYILIEYYTPTGLNKKDSDSYYPGSSIQLQGFTTSGIRIFHVDARMVAYTAQSGPYYVDKVNQSNSVATTIAHSNSSAYNHLNPEFRLIQLMDATKKRNFDMDNDPTNQFLYKNAYADNSSLFMKGDVFTYEKYKNSFPAYRYAKQSSMNNGSVFSKTITIDNITSEGATITIS